MKMNDQNGRVSSVGAWAVYRLGKGPRQKNKSSDYRITFFFKLSLVTTHQDFFPLFDVGCFDILCDVSELRVGE